MYHIRHISKRVIGDIARPHPDLFAVVSVTGQIVKVCRSRADAERVRDQYNQGESTDPCGDDEKEE